MGRWTDKKSSPSVTAAPIPVPSSSQNTFKAPHAGGYNSVKEASVAPIVQPPMRSEDQVNGSSADAVAEEALTTLNNSSLSQAQQQSWQVLCAACAAATPPADQTKAGPPPPEVLAAMQAARTNREDFIAGLAPTHKEVVQKLLELEKKERKLRLKEDSVRFKTENAAGRENAQAATEVGTAEKKLQKDVITQAFWLWQEDRKKEMKTNQIDSTEWKRIRALGGKEPTFKRYLLRAGWEKSWPLPEPEGRLLRREGQEVALATYSRK